MISLNMIWPAIYVYDEIWRFWFLVFATITIETIAIKMILKYTWTKSFLSSIIGNLVSGLVGTFVMMWAMLFWHLIADNFVPNATFDIINWIATYILMCLGSVFIETVTVSLIFKDSLKRLFIPLLVGNLMTYGFIAYTRTTKTNKDPDEAKTEEVFYKSIPNRFFLLDSTSLDIYSSKIDLSLDKNDQILNENYNLQIRFDKENPKHFQFELRYIDNEYAGGIQDGYKSIKLNELRDTINVILEQKNPKKGVGWKEPIVTDTIKFIRVR
ncbi:hypothetical protein [Aquimarina mytili]|uniref:Uncharacterized protein n=1 Tax=Aquimarina mytili TaxID=874423 RepID=A0A937A0M2_9FLAO|nr:hypothetical protein [Aquimarina mytili]MBL0685320.1 hypothetical protein [Aquimarina mytili]